MDIQDPCCFNDVSSPPGVDQTIASINYEDAQPTCRIPKAPKVIRVVYPRNVPYIKDKIRKKSPKHPGRKGKTQANTKTQTKAKMGSGLFSVEGAILPNLPNQGFPKEEKVCSKKRIYWFESDADDSNETLPCKKSKIGRQEDNKEKFQAISLNSITVQNILENLPSVLLHRLPSSIGSSVKVDQEGRVIIKKKPEREFNSKPTEPLQSKESSSKQDQGSGCKQDKGSSCKNGKDSRSNKYKESSYKKDKDYSYKKGKDYSYKKDKESSSKKDKVPSIRKQEQLSLPSGIRKDDEKSYKSLLQVKSLSPDKKRTDLSSDAGSKKADSKKDKIKEKIPHKVHSLEDNFSKKHLAESMPESSTKQKNIHALESGKNPATQTTQSLKVGPQIGLSKAASGWKERSLVGSSTPSAKREQVLKVIGATKTESLQKVDKKQSKSLELNTLAKAGASVSKEQVANKDRSLNKCLSKPSAPMNLLMSLAKVQEEHLSDHQNSTKLAEKCPLKTSEVRNSCKPKPISQVITTIPSNIEILLKCESSNPPVLSVKKPEFLLIKNSKINEPNQATTSAMAIAEKSTETSSKSNVLAEILCSSSTLFASQEQSSELSISLQRKSKENKRFGDGSHTPRFDDGSHTPRFDDGSHTPRFDDGSYAPSFDDGSHTLRFDDGSYAPSFDGGFHAPRLEGGSHAQRLDGGSHTQRAADGFRTPRDGYNSNATQSNFPFLGPLPNSVSYDPSIIASGYYSLSQTYSGSVSTQVENSSQIRSPFYQETRFNNGSHNNPPQISIATQGNFPAMPESRFVRGFENTRASSALHNNCLSSQEPRSARVYDIPRNNGRAQMSITSQNNYASQESRGYDNPRINGTPLNNYHASQESRLARGLDNPQINSTQQTNSTSQRSVYPSQRPHIGSNAPQKSFSQISGDSSSSGFALPSAPRAPHYYPSPRDPRVRTPSGMSQHYGISPAMSQQMQAFAVSPYLASEFGGTPMDGNFYLQNSMAQVPCYEKENEPHYYCRLCDWFDSDGMKCNDEKIVQKHILNEHGQFILDYDLSSTFACPYPNCKKVEGWVGDPYYHLAFDHNKLFLKAKDLGLEPVSYTACIMDRPLHYQCLKCLQKLSTMDETYLHLATKHYCSLIGPQKPMIIDGKIKYVCTERGCLQKFRTKLGVIAHEQIFHKAMQGYFGTVIENDFMLKL